MIRQVITIGAKSARAQPRVARREASAPRCPSPRRTLFFLARPGLPGARPDRKPQARPALNPSDWASRRPSRPADRAFLPKKRPGSASEAPCRAEGISKDGRRASCRVPACRTSIRCGPGCRHREGHCRPQAPGCRRGRGLASRGYS